MLRMILVLLAVSSLTACGWFEQNTASPPAEQEKKVTTVDVEKSQSAEPNKSRMDRPAIETFFFQYEVRLPHANTVSVCSGHGCQIQKRWQFKIEFLAELKEVFKNSTDAFNERLAIKKALALIEAKVGPDTGTHVDKRGAALRNTGVRGHLDATDEALNVLSYLMMLQKHDLIRHHHIAGPAWKWFGVIQNHYGVVIQEIEKTTLWVIDAGIGDNGEEPLIIEMNEWFRS